MQYLKISVLRNQIQNETLIIAYNNIILLTFDIPIHYIVNVI